MLDNVKTALWVGALAITNATTNLGLNVFSEGAQDKILSPAEIGALKEAGIDVHELKTGGGGKKASRFDLYKNKAGEINVKPKGGKGPGESTGLNINDYPIP